MKDYEEYHEWSRLGSWVFILAHSFFLIGWAMLLMTLVKDTPRQWDFGTVEFIPAKSIYSTHAPAETTDRNMVQPLPEASPLKKRAETE